MTTDLFQVRLWAILGPPNSGKSSIIGALTSQAGKGSGGQRDIQLRGGGWLRMNAYRQSRQEAKLNPEAVSKKFLGMAKAQQKKAPFAYFNLLLALRTDSVNGLPEADEYLSHFVTLGWDIRSLVLLSPKIKEYDHYAMFGAPLSHIPDSEKMTATSLERNWVFGQVRNHFGWA